MEIELERTFLLKYKPKGLFKSLHCKITDIYFPKDEFHPVLRLRNRDNKKFEMTKKFPINGKDSSEQEEHTTILSKKEYSALAKAPGKKVVKTRYYYKILDGQIAEIDIFEDKLKGLALVDVEFNDKNKKDEFVPPDFCLADVSQDKWLAGGLLAGKAVSNLKKVFQKYNYKKIT
jgi:CYTH domain-containing protein